MIDIASLVDGLGHSGVGEAGDGIDEDIVQEHLVIALIKQVEQQADEEELIRALDDYARRCELDMGELCQANHADFVQSVEQLLKIRQRSAALNEQIGRLNAMTQASGKLLTTEKHAHLQSLDLTRKMETAVETLQASLKVLGLVNRAHQLIRSHKNYSALKTLEELQSFHLKDDIVMLKFAEQISSSIPALQNLVEKAVMDDYYAWLDKLDVLALAVGQAAFRQMYSRQVEWQTKTAQANWHVFAGMNSAIEQAINEKEEFDYIDNEYVTVDFGPLYECVHIHSELGSFENFRSRYDNDRRKHRDIVFPLNTADMSGDLGKFEDLLTIVVGFLIIEYTTLLKVKGLRTRKQIDELSEGICSRIYQTVSRMTAKVNDNQDLLRLIDIFHLFILTLQSFGYSSHRLLPAMPVLFQAYISALETRIGLDLDQVLEDDDYMPMVVNNEEEYENILRVSWVDLKCPDITQFPCSLPFSQLYPLCCIDIRNFISEYFLLYDQDTVFSGVTDGEFFNLLVEHIDKKIAARLLSQNLAQIVQILINLEYLERTTLELDRLLNEIKPSGNYDNCAAKATKSFGATRKAAEKRVFELVNSKIDDFFQLADYDWQKSIARSSPSPYLQDVVNFLTTVVNSSLQNLPDSLKKFVYFDALDHIASSLMAILTNPAIRRVSREAIVDFDQDIRYLEEYIQGLDDDNLREADTLLELRQSVNLLLSDNWDDYLNIPQRMKYYNRVNLQKAIVLLERLLAFLPAYPLNNTDRNRRKALEASIRDLKKG